MIGQNRLEAAYRNAECIPIGPGSRIVCMSDCHRGIGNHGDNFLPNQNVFYAALKYYYDRGFSYMELGDGDELWENRRLNRIVDFYSDIFRLLTRFCREDRFFMLYGNHDCRKKDGKFLQNHCKGCYCMAEGCYRELFSEIRARESILLKDCTTGHGILLLHGHQGDLMNDFLWPVTALLVRYLWRPLELFGISDPTSTARNYKKRKRTEKRLAGFAEKKQLLLIAGHTHRPVLPRPGESLYLNVGSCVHPRSITALELEGSRLTLVKWSIMARYGRSLSVEREVLSGPYLLKAYWEEC